MADVYLFPGEASPPDVRLRQSPPQVQNPFAQTDWPNPPLRSFTPPPEPQLDLLGTTLATVAAPFQQTDWPNPFLRPSVLRPDAQLDLLGTTLAAPFRQTDWPNPQRTLDFRAALDFYGFGQQLEAELALPLAQFDWPNPMRRGDGMVALAFYAGNKPPPVKKASERVHGMMHMNSPASPGVNTRSPGII